MGLAQSLMGNIGANIKRNIIELETFRSILKPLSTLFK